MAKQHFGRKLGAVAPLFLAAFAMSPARADLISGDATNYAVLYEGTGGHNLSISNVTINGNVGVGGTGVVQFSGPGTITGELDFSAANTGQFHNTNGMNVGPTSVNYNVAAVTNALNTVNGLSTTWGGETGTDIAINGTETLNASDGTLDGSGNEVFTITSYSENDGKVLTINGNGHNVVLNYAAGGNPQYGGDVVLTNGLTDDQVVWNYTGTNNLSLNNNASSFGLPDAFMGIILAPNAKISLTNANLDGRVFGGDSADMQIVSGDTINAPPGGGSTGGGTGGSTGGPPIPEPASLVLLGTVLFGAGCVAKKRIA